MAQQINQCERMGVNPKWPSYKSVLGRIAKVPTHEEFHRNAIREYVTREDAAPTQQLPNKRNITDYTTERLARDQVCRALATAPDELSWLSDLAYWLRYFQVGIKQQFFWHHRYNILFPKHPDGGLRMFSIETSSNMMGAMALLGWNEAVIYHGYLIHAALNRTYQLQLQYEEQHRRAQAFMLRVFADWVGDVSHQWPAYAYDEPVYETLLANWRTPNPDDLLPCLLAA